VIGEVLQSLSLSWSQVLFIGNDIQDLALLKKAGFSAAPIDSVKEVLCNATYIATAKGGEGVVREVLEIVLEAQGYWEEIIARERSLG